MGDVGYSGALDEEPMPVLLDVFAPVALSNDYADLISKPGTRWCRTERLDLSAGQC